MKFSFDQIERIKRESMKHTQDTAVSNNDIIALRLLDLIREMEEKEEESEKSLKSLLSQLVVVRGTGYEHAIYDTARNSIAKFISYVIGLV